MSEKNRGTVIDRHFNIWFIVFDYPGLTIQEIQDRLEVDHQDKVCVRTVSRALQTLERKCLVYSRSTDSGRQWLSNCELRIRHNRAA